MSPRCCSRVCLVAVVMACALALPNAAQPGDVAVLLRADDRAMPEDEAWIPARISDLVEERLDMIGIPVLDRRFADGGVAGFRALVKGTVRPSAMSDPKGKITIDAEIDLGQKRIERRRIEGVGNALEHLASALVLAIAKSVDVDVSADAAALLDREEYPFDVHRLLGLARAELGASSDRKAMLTYDRASKLENLGAIPEAVDGRLRAESALVSRGESEFGARADLAPPAEERAEVALKHGDDKEAMRALEAVLRYTPERALRWRVEVAIDRRTSTVIARGQKWIVQRGEGEQRRWTIDPRTGVVVKKDSSLRGLVDMASGHPLVLDERSLSRLDEHGRPRWKVGLPIRPRSLGTNAVDLSSGLAGIIGERAVAWVEVSFGSLGQVATDVKPLASGTGGVIVEMLSSKDKGEDTIEIGLLRPGKKTPAWTSNVPRPRAAAMTVDRVLLTTKDGLLVLRAHDGREANHALSVPPETRILGAEGRYAALALDDEAVAIVDVLAGERTASFRGPSTAVAAYTSANGMAILYASGDLVFYDRFGKMLDRARVPGEPYDLLRGTPIAPGPVAVTSRGLFAYAEVGDGAKMRDVDAMLKLASVFLRAKASEVALRWAKHVAMMSAGRIAEAEAMRAELLSARGDAASKKAAEAAKQRAEAAKDPAKPLPAFSLTPK